MFCLFFYHPKLVPCPITDAWDTTGEATAVLFFFYFKKKNKLKRRVDCYSRINLNWKLSKTKMKMKNKKMQISCSDKSGKKHQDLLGMQCLCKMFNFFLSSTPWPFLVVVWLEWFRLMHWPKTAIRQLYNYKFILTKSMKQWAWRWKWQNQILKKFNWNKWTW